MSDLKSKIVRFIVSEDGPTAVEYAMMLALIIVGAIGAVLSTGNVQKALFEDVAQELYDSMNSN